MHQRGLPAFHLLYRFLIQRQVGSTFCHVHSGGGLRSALSSVITLSRKGRLWKHTEWRRWRWRCCCCRCSTNWLYIFYVFKEDEAKPKVCSGIFFYCELGLLRTLSSLSPSLPACSKLHYTLVFSLKWVTTIQADHPRFPYIILVNANNKKRVEVHLHLEAQQPRLSVSWTPIIATTVNQAVHWCMCLVKLKQRQCPSSQAATSSQAASVALLPLPSVAVAAAKNQSTSKAHTREYPAAHHHPLKTIVTKGWQALSLK